MKWILPELTVANKEDTARKVANSLELGCEIIIDCSNPPPHMMPT